MRDERPTPAAPEMLPEAIVSLVADLEGVDATEIPPLGSVIDPDALVTIFDAPEGSESNSVEFDYAGYRIRVRGDGDVHALEASPVELCNAD